MTNEQVNENENHITMCEQEFIERIRETKEGISVDLICEDLIKKFFASLPKEIIPGEHIPPLVGSAYNFAYLRKSEANPDEDIFALFFDKKKKYVRGGNEEEIKATIVEFAEKIVEAFTVRGLYYELEVSKSVSKETTFNLKFFLDINELVEMA